MRLGANDKEENEEHFSRCCYYSMYNGFMVMAHANTSLHQFPVLDPGNHNKKIIAKPGTMHCSSQDFLSATKPNLHT